MTGRTPADYRNARLERRLEFFFAVPAVALIAAGVLLQFKLILDLDTTRFAAWIAYGVAGLCWALIVIKRGLASEVAIRRFDRERAAARSHGEAHAGDGILRVVGTVEPLPDAFVENGSRIAAALRGGNLLGGTFLLHGDDGARYLVDDDRLELWTPKVVSDVLREGDRAEIVGPVLTPADESVRAVFVSNDDELVHVFRRLDA